MWRGDLCRLFLHLGRTSLWFIYLRDYWCESCVGCVRAVRCSEVDKILRWTHTYSTDCMYEFRQTESSGCLCECRQLLAWSVSYSVLWSVHRSFHAWLYTGNTFTVSTGPETEQDWARQEEDPPTHSSRWLPLYLPLCSPCHGLSFTGWQQAT